MSTSVEEAGTSIDAQNVPNPLPEDPIRKDRIRTVEDPFFGEDIPKPEGDPFEALLKPLLERDSKQCDTWKDEVQNILIFAGLFSAVITAFIIESYQKLQADPNDQIVTLLARISDQLASLPNSTTAPMISSSNAAFTPLRSDMRVNVFWFISLVLSLTAALIGIITLQWLREHQRYDSSIKPMEAFAIFNARSEGMRRWYVPQIFAVLPLLLQGALVLFFVGLTDFLFNIQIDVAIPVLVSLCIPILFLVATTVLPTVQLYALQFPHHLSVNYHVPAPCPFKSPQSLIARRVAILSQTFFRCCVYLFAVIYAPFVITIRAFMTAEKPFYGELAPFYGDTGVQFKRMINLLRYLRGDWMVLDTIWITVRTGYVVVVRTPDNLRGKLPDSSHSLWQNSLYASDGFYDCVEGILMSTYSIHDRDNSSAVRHHCGEVLVGKLCSDWHRNLVHEITDDLEYKTSLMRGRCMAIMAILGPLERLPTDYLHTRPGEMLPDGKVLHNAFHTVLMSQTQHYAYGIESSKLRKISQRWIESDIRFIATYLLENTRQFFECTSIKVPLQSWMAYRPIHYRREIELHCPAWMNDMSQQWTLILTNIIQNSLEMKAVTLGAPHACSSLPPCSGDIENDNVKDLMKCILIFQVYEDIKHTLQLLNRYCTSAPNAIHDLPYVLVIACAYIDAVAVAGCSEGVATEFSTLLKTVSSICGHQTESLSPDNIRVGAWHWDGFESALTYIRDNQTPRVLNTPKHCDSLENPDFPIVHQANYKAPENV